MPYVITHPEDGIFLGQAMGLGFWSKLDAGGQDAAVTFETEADARQFISDWNPGPRPGIELKQVTPDLGQYASAQACEAAGLEPWQPDVTAENRSAREAQHMS